MPDLAAMDGELSELDDGAGPRGAPVLRRDLLHAPQVLGGEFPAAGVGL